MQLPPKRTGHPPCVSVAVVVLYPSLKPPAPKAMMRAFGHPPLRIIALGAGGFGPPPGRVAGSFWRTLIDFHGGGRILSFKWQCPSTARGFALFVRPVDVPPGCGASLSGMSLGGASLRTYIRIKTKITHFCVCLALRAGVRGDYR